MAYYINKSYEATCSKVSKQCDSPHDEEGNNGNHIEHNGDRTNKKIHTSRTTSMHKGPNLSVIVVVHNKMLLIAEYLKDALFSNRNTN